MDVRPAMFGFRVYTFCSTALAVMATHQDGRFEGRVHICVQYVILGDWVALPLYAKSRSIHAGVDVCHCLWLYNITSRVFVPQPGIPRCSSDAWRW
jgi:hypothetical protein